MAAVTLAELRARVRERCHISANDPMFPDAIINRRLNLAYGDMTATVQPDGWWWQHVERDYQNVSGADQPTVFVQTNPPDNTRSVRKVYSVFGGIDGVYWLPIPPRERQDAIRLAGGQRASNGAIPLCYSVKPLMQGDGLGNRTQLALQLDPPLPNLAYLRFMMVVYPADFTADGTFAIGLPSILADLIVEQAVIAVLRQKRTVGTVTTRRRYATELSIAKEAAKEWLKAARVFMNSSTAGPGYVTQRDRS